MDNAVVFQNHVFYLKEEGIYETKDSFVLDNENWTWGGFPDAILICRIVDNQSYPWLLSYEDSCFPRMSHIAYAENHNCILATHTDLTKPELSSIL